MSILPFAVRSLSPVMYNPTPLFPLRFRFSEFISVSVFSVYIPIPPSPVFIIPFTVNTDLWANTPTPLILFDISIIELPPRIIAESVIGIAVSKFPAYIP